MMHKKNAELK